MQCLHPYRPKDGDAVPCGRCIACVKNRMYSWCYRLVQESKVSSSAYFVTLTYNNEFLPITRKGLQTLDLVDLQQFFKRLRKRNKERLKYYAVGEYGGRFKRPHYHIILFNARLETIDDAWCKKGKTMGNTKSGSVGEASIVYTLKYMNKPSGRRRKHKNDDRIDKFGVMSKGLGGSYFTQAMFLWHHAEPAKRMYCNLKDGKKIAMPRYYKERIYTKEEREYIQYLSKAEFDRQADKKSKEITETYGDKYKKVRIESDIRQLEKMEKEFLKHV